jgi:hypothetical protein
VASQARAIPFETIALSGTPPVGAPAGTTIDSFEFPAINANGQVAFLAFGTMPAGGGTNYLGIARRDPGSMAPVVVAQVDSPPSQGSGARLGVLLAPRGFNDSGQVLFTSDLQRGIGGVTAGNDEGIWLANADGSVQQLARKGDPAAGLDDPYWELAGAGETALVNNLGNAAFSIATSSNGFAYSGIFGPLGADHRQSVRDLRRSGHWYLSSDGKKGESLLDPRLFRIGQVRKIPFVVSISEPGMYLVQFQALYQERAFDDEKPSRKEPVAIIALEQTAHVAG